MCCGDNGFCMGLFFIVVGEVGIGEKVFDVVCFVVVVGLWWVIVFRSIVW